MKTLFFVTFSEAQERALGQLRGWLPDASIISSSFACPLPLAKAMLPDAVASLQEASVLANISGGVWPKTEQETLSLLCEEPTDLLAWRRRLYATLAITKNMLFAVDDKVGSSQELITLLTAARLIKAKTIGFIPAGALPAAVPLTVLGAADALMSGEADERLAGVILRSLTGEG